MPLLGATVSDGTGVKGSSKGNRIAGEEDGERSKGRYESLVILLKHLNFIWE